MFLIIYSKKSIKNKIYSLYNYDIPDFESLVTGANTQPYILQNKNIEKQDEILFQNNVLLNNSNIQPVAFGEEFENKDELSILLQDALDEQGWSGQVIDFLKGVVGSGSVKLEDELAR